MEFDILEKLWQRTLNPNISKVHDENCTWKREIEILYRMGIGIEDALRYLYFEKPSLILFKEWILKNKNTISINEQDLDEDVLSEEDLIFWKKNGYVVVRNAIPRSECEATQKAIWEFLEMNPDQEESWYQRNVEQRGLMLTFYNHPTLNKNRQSKRIQKAYEQLYGTTQIYKTIDKVSFNPPEKDNFHFLGSSLHWDVSLHLPIPYAFQGLLYLTDCGIDDCAFHCFSGFHKKLEALILGLSLNVALLNSFCLIPSCFHKWYNTFLCSILIFKPAVLNFFCKRREIAVDALPVIKLYNSPFLNWLFGI